MKTGAENLIFYAVIIVSLFISRIPYIGKYFKGLNTLIHESGHAFMALLLNAEILAVELHIDTSGVAITKSNSKFKHFLVSVVGYPFASAFAFLMFYFIKQEKFNYIFFTLLTIAVINLIFWIKNKYGYFWIISFLAINSLLLYYANDYWKNIFLLFIATIMLSESTISTVQLLIINFKDSKKAGDSKNLGRITFIPSYFWSLLFVFVSIFFLYKTLMLFYPDIIKL